MLENSKNNIRERKERTTLGLKFSFSEISRRSRWMSVCVGRSGKSARLPRSLGKLKKPSHSRVDQNKRGRQHSISLRSRTIAVVCFRPGFDQWPHTLLSVVINANKWFIVLVLFLSFRVSGANPEETQRTKNNKGIGWRKIPKLVFEKKNTEKSRKCWTMIIGRRVPIQLWPVLSLADADFNLPIDTTRTNGNCWRL